MDSYNSPGKGGHVALLQVREATAPESMEDRAGQSRASSACQRAGWCRACGSPGRRGHPGTGRFKVDATYGYEPYRGVEVDPVVRLRRILDVGLHKRLALPHQVTAYGDPTPKTTTCRTSWPPTPT